jgi:hypothetical protein
MNSTDYSPCSTDETLLKPEIILSIFLIISEILPFIKRIKSNGIVQAIHIFIFHNDTEESEPLL